MRASLSIAPVRPLPPRVTARPLAPGDGDSLGALMASAYRGTVEDHGESADWHLREAHRCLTGAFGPVVWTASLAAVAASAVEFVGASVVTQDGPHLLLAFALVVPAWQGRGLGTALLSRSAAALRAAGHAEWTLAVAHDNPARRLYQRLGFVVDESLRIS